MILTCPSCGTQYVVKDGAIPASGRQVRCKACQHSWREFPAALDGPLELDREAPEQTAPSEAEEPAAEAVDEPVDQSALAQEDEPAPEEAFEEASEPEPEPDPYSYDRDGQPEDTPPIPPETDVAGLAEAAPSHRLEWVEHDDDFTPFARRGPETTKSRGRVIIGAVVVLLIAAIVAGVWFLAPAEWRQRLGVASAGETPLQLMMTHSDRTQLASGNEFLNISGRIINPTDQQQQVPPIHAQLHDASGKVVYKWTIPPPARTLPPGGSTSFNSAELNIPSAAQELTVTLGEPKI